MIEILNIDCMEYMSRLKDRSFDLAVVDPPYGIGAEIGMNKNTKQKFLHRRDDRWDSAPPEKAYFDELFRISENQVIFGANHFIERFARNSSCWLVWDKSAACRGRSFADAELAWTSFQGVVRIKTFNPTAPSYIKKHPKIHPTQKPVELYAWILELFSMRGKRVFDSHLGSGSSAIAAYYFDCDFVGCELWTGSTAHRLKSVLKRSRDSSGCSELQV